SAAASGAATAPQRKLQVIMFSTSWCPSCRAARAFFQSKGVPFREFDVERNPQAARAYVAIARKHGLRPGAVPLIVINGKVYQGFSRLQIASALNQG
ncbi:MAG: glutaredoxin family protein, partial [Myxococcales bacterium]|nr:glutaredoxin family protein [Myxococcales bacterium]